MMFSFSGMLFGVVWVFGVVGMLVGLLVDVVCMLLCDYVLWFVVYVW